MNWIGFFSQHILNGSLSNKIVMIKQIQIENVTYARQNMPFRDLKLVKYPYMMAI